MSLELNALSEQVIVITGASSGIGLVTAKAAAKNGAAVVLAARNEHDLQRAVEEIRREGGRAVHVVADVAIPEDVQRIGDTAVREFGRIDTWVNNAGVAVYGKMTDVSIEDMRRQFDVMYWGTLYGSRTAVEHLRRDGGAIINVASVLAERAVPLQGNYSAAKHAIKAMSDALRMELEADGVPISVTVIKPASIDTPFFDKAKSYSGLEPLPIPPVYAPELVAEAIVEAAQRPIRELMVGSAGAGLSIGEVLAPRLTDRYMERTMFDQQQSSERADRPDNLHQHVAHDGGARGSNWKGRVMTRSAYTEARLHSREVGRLVLGAAGLALGAFVVRALRDRDKPAARTRPAALSAVSAATNDYSAARV